MVHLVLEGARQQALAFDGAARRRVRSSPLHDRARRPGDRRVESRHAEAALFLELHAFALDELGVDDHDEIAAGRGRRETSTTKIRSGDADLRRGEADARRGVHGLDHVVDRASAIAGVIVVDGARRLVQDGSRRSRRIGRITDQACAVQTARHAAANLSRRRLAVARSRSVDRVAAEFLEQRVGEHERDHRFADDRGGGDGADVAALDRGRALRSSVVEIDRAQRLHQRRDRLHVSR